MVYLFLLPHLLLLSAPDLISAAAALLIYAAAGYGVIRFEKTHSPKPLFRFQYPLITSAATLALGALFYFRFGAGRSSAAAERRLIRKSGSSTFSTRSISFAPG